VWVYIQDGLQAKQSVTPAEGSSAAGGAAAALLAMQASSNEHHVSDSFSFYCWWKLHITCTIAAFTVTATAAALLPQLHNSLPLCHSFRRYAAAYTATKNDPSAAWPHTGAQAQPMLRMRCTTDAAALSASESQSCGAHLLQPSVNCLL